MRVARWLMFATLLVPMLVFPGFLFPFVTIRAVYFRVLVELAAAILLFLVVRREVTVHFRRDVVLWCLVAWVAANAIAAAFGVAPMRSLFGDHERMGGVWLWLHLLAYYALLRTVMRPTDWPRFFQSAVAVAVIVSAYGLAQQWFQPFNFGVGGVAAGSTIGNPGLLAPYLLANVAFCAVLAVRARNLMRVAYAGIAALFIVAVIFSGNRSSTLALIVGVVAALAFYTVSSHGREKRRAVMRASLFAVVAAGALTVMILRPPWLPRVVSRIPAFDRLSSGGDTLRIMQWRAATRGIRERPLLGVGPENYQIIWSRHYDPRMERIDEDSRWDRAHNAYLEAFATAGILGFVSLLAVLFAIVWSAWEAARTRAASPTATAARSPPFVVATATGLVAAYAFYLFFWFFDLNSAMLLLALAALVAGSAVGVPLVDVGRPRQKRWQSTAIVAFGAVALLAVVYVHGYETLKMAHALNRTRDTSRPVQEKLADFEAVFASPAPVTQHAFAMYAAHLRSLNPRFASVRSDPVGATRFDSTFVRAIEEFQSQAEHDPLNDRVLVHHAMVLMSGARYYKSAQLYDLALQKLWRAVELAPRRVAIRLVLGTAYLDRGDHRRALQVYQSAYALYPPSGQTHSYIAAAFAKLGEYDSAGVWLRSALTRGRKPNVTFVQEVALALAERGASRAGAELLSAYLREEAAPHSMWTAQAGAGGYESAATAGVAAQLFDAAGDRRRADAFRAAAVARCARPLPLASLASLGLRQQRLGRAPDCREPWRSQIVL